MVASECINFKFESRLFSYMISRNRGPILITAIILALVAVIASDATYGYFAKTPMHCGQICVSTCPVLWLKFDGNLKDSSPYNSDLTLKSVYSEVPDKSYLDTYFVKDGVFNKAVLIYGYTYGQYVEVTPKNEYKDIFDFGTRDFTFDFWVKPIAGGAGHGTIAENYRYPWRDSGGDIFSDSQGWYLLTEEDMYNPEENWKWIRLNIFDSSGSAVIAANATVGEWMHAVVMRSGDSLELYLNGVKVAEEENIAVINVTSRGVFSFVSSWDNVDANIDEFRVWNRALSDTEIQSLYNFNELR